MRGDRVEVVVDTGQGVQTFDIAATKNGRRIEVTTARGIVEVTEVTRGGTPVRTGRFMSSRLIALVEHPAQEVSDGRVDVTTRRRMRPPTAADYRPSLGARRCPSGIVFEGQVRGRSRCRSCDAREASKGRRGTAFVSLSTQPKWVRAV
jgi:hypothetical protein